MIDSLLPKPAVYLGTVTVEGQDIFLYAMTFSLRGEVAIAFVNGYVCSEDAHIAGVYPGDGDNLVAAQEDVIDRYNRAKQCSGHYWDGRFSQFCTECNKPQGTPIPFGDSRWTTLDTLTLFFDYCYPIETPA